MSEPFRRRVEAPIEPDIAPPAPIENKSDKLRGDETKASDELTSDEKILDIWEGLNRRKFITDYFDIGNIDGEFNLKMDTSVIDKYIKGELEKLSYEKNIENYQKLLQEIEEEIGSRPLELFSRIKKITGFIKAVNRLEEAKRKKELYLNREF